MHSLVQSTTARANTAGRAHRAPACRPGALQSQGAGTAGTATSLTPPRRETWGRSRPSFDRRQASLLCRERALPKHSILNKQQPRADGRGRTDASLTGLAYPITSGAWPALWCSTTELHPLPGLMTSLGNLGVISPSGFTPRLRFDLVAMPGHLAYPVPAWRERDSNPYHLGYEPSALPLSYPAPMLEAPVSCVGTRGLEPPMSCSQSRRLSH